LKTSVSKVRVRKEGKFWFKLAVFLKVVVPNCLTMDEGTVIEWLSNLGENYTAYAELFSREQVNGETLLKLTKADLEELGVHPVHYMNIMLELEKLKKGKPFLFSPWGAEDVVNWLEENGLVGAQCNTMNNVFNISGDLLCLMTRENLVRDLKLSEDSAQSLIDLREEHLLDRTCFGVILAEGEEVDNHAYELLRGGRITSSLLLKEHTTYNEQKLLTELTPELLKKLRTFAKTVYV
jgi:hypothetical protein